MMPLTMAKSGERVTVRKITGKDEIRQHLAELGFVVDSDITVVSEIAGNLIVQVKDLSLIHICCPVRTDWCQPCGSASQV